MTREPRFWLGLVTVLVGLLVSSVGVEAQCVVTKTITFMSPASPPMFPFDSTRVTKFLSAAASCMTVSMNAYGCGELPSDMAATKLRASALTATMTPFCNWVCNCGTPLNPGVRIDGNDGLPVELMDFGIEAEETSKSAEESNDGEGEAVR